MFSYRTANKEDGARLDIVAESFWGRDGQRAFLTLEFLTLWHKAIATHLSSSAIAEMSLKKKNESEK